MKRMSQLTQFDEGLVKPIKDFGCYFLSLHYYVAKYKNTDFGILRINKAYDMFLRRNYISSNCFVLEPEKLCAYYGLKVKVRYDDPNYDSKEDEFVISKVKFGFWTVNYHFIATENGKVLYDSLLLKKRRKKFQEVETRVYTLL